MTSVAVLDGGTYYHHRALYGERYQDYFSKVIYVRELESTCLNDFDIVIVPDRIHPGLLRAAARHIARYLDQGGTLVALGETESHTWLPNIAWSNRPTNFWWWKTAGATLGLYAATPEHTLFQYLSIKQASWHYHGVFTPPSGAVTLIGVEGDGAVLYEDTVSTPGRLVISSLDPFYHYGSYFMPITEQFLDGFLKWLNAPCNPTLVKPEAVI